MKDFKFEVYQLPFSVMESLSEQGKPTSFLYWGKEKSDTEYEFSRETARDLYERNGYRAVARFDVTQLEDIYDLSNNPYLDEEQVAKRIDRIERMHSVSVGDLILDRESNEFYIVAPFGFDKMECRMRRVL